ncbi:MAG: diguanylate cyclase domain-containing protein [Cyanobium sp.]
MLQEAVGVAEAIRLASAQPVESNGAAIHTTFSIGVVLAEPGETIDALNSRDDQAMDRAKPGGRTS